MLQGKLSQSEYSEVAKSSNSPLYANYYVVVEEHFYEFTSTKIELEGKHTV